MWHLLPVHGTLKRSFPCWALSSWLFPVGATALIHFCKIHFRITVWKEKITFNYDTGQKRGTLREYFSKMDYISKHCLLFLYSFPMQWRGQTDSLGSTKDRISGSILHTSRTFIKWQHCSTNSQITQTCYHVLCPLKVGLEQYDLGCADFFLSKRTSEGTNLTIWFILWLEQLILLFCLISL